MLFYFLFGIKYLFVVINENKIINKDELVLNNQSYFYFFFLIIYYKVILFYYQIDINEVLFKNDFFDLMIYIVIDVKFDNRINLFLMVIKILEYLVFCVF